MFRTAGRVAAALAVGAVLLPSRASADSLKRYDQEGFGVMLEVRQCYQPRDRG